jgi:hypothetical protein
MYEFDGDASPSLLVNDLHGRAATSSQISGLLARGMIRRHGIFIDENADEGDHDRRSSNQQVLCPAHRTVWMGQWSRTGT